RTVSVLGRRRGRGPLQPIRGSGDRRAVNRGESLDMRMNRIASLWMAAALAVTSAVISRAQAPAGDPAPTVLAIGSAAPMADTKMTGVNDKEITLAEAAGKKGTMVIFMCNHCPWVKAWQTRIAKIGNTAVSKG